MKTCAVCKNEVTRGTGTFLGGRLIHLKRCKAIVKMQPYRLD